MRDNSFLDLNLLSETRRESPLYLQWPAPGLPGGFIEFTTTTQWRAFVLSLSLPPGIPEVVSVKFRRAQMLYFLAWNYFDVIKAGELMGLATLELALNDRYGAKVEKRGKYRSFAALLRHMLVDGLTDDKIPMVQRCGGSVIGFIDGSNKPGLAERRNIMAHGDPFDGDPVGGLLEVVRDLIQYAYRDMVPPGVTGILGNS
jgi:hypothetical protein